MRLIRSWAGHPLCMVQELDESFDAVMMIGYHSAAGSEENSLAHTLSLDAAEIRINGKPASEFTVHALASSMLGVPTVFISGDKGLMDHVEAANPHIGRCAVKEGRGQSTISMTPAAAVKSIRHGAAEALAGDLKRCLLPLPQQFIVEITYNNPNLACRHQHYPGMVHVGASHRQVRDGELSRCAADAELRDMSESRSTTVRIHRPRCPSQRHGGDVDRHHAAGHRHHCD